MGLDLGAILTAMVTPFDARGELDEDAAVVLMEHLLEHGSDGLVLCGTTGEASTLADEEKLRLIRLGVQEGRRSHLDATIVAGVGHNDTRHTVQLTERVTELRPAGGPWSLVPDGADMAIVDRASGRPAAWVPAALRPVVRVGEAAWAGVSGSDLHLVTLEGDGPGGGASDVATPPAGDHYRPPFFSPPIDSR